MGFEKKHGGYHIEKEFDKLINEINEKKTPNLIIDLRYNSGGDPLMGGRMAAQLIDRPFKVYERLILTPPGKPEYLSCMSDRLVMRLRTFGVKEVNDHYEKVHFDRGLKLVQPATNRYKGKIYVITGPMTVSTSSMFCSYLKGQSNVVFVGQETKGGINYLCAHESCEIRLPYSGVVATFGLQIVEVNKGSSDHEKSEGLIPDKCIEYSVEEFLAGKDKEMEWIKNDLLRK